MYKDYRIILIIFLIIGALYFYIKPNYIAKYCSRIGFRSSLLIMKDFSIRMIPEYPDIAPLDIEIDSNSNFKINKNDRGKYIEYSGYFKFSVPKDINKLEKVRSESVEVKETYYMISGQSHNSTKVNYFIDNKGNLFKIDEYLVTNQGSDDKITSEACGGEFIVNR